MIYGVFLSEDYTICPAFCLVYLTRICLAQIKSSSTFLGICLECRYRETLPNSYINQCFKRRKNGDISFLLHDTGVSLGMLIPTQPEHSSVSNVKMTQQNQYKLLLDELFRNK